MPVAQLDRVSDSDSEGRAFESHQAYQNAASHCLPSDKTAAFRTCRLLILNSRRIR